MASTSNPSSLGEFSAPTNELNKLSMDCSDRATGTPKARKVQSETSLATMTPPDSASGTGTALGDAARVTQDDGPTIFVKARDTDDVFGASSTIPTMPKSDAERIAAKIQQTEQQTDIATPNSNKPAPRADRINSPITPANAQGVLPPDACIFVANLAMAQTDEQFQHPCHQAFNAFGECLIKVRRDKHKHPFAIVQFYDAKQAAAAIEGARDLIVDGRRIRTEPVQARRTALLVKIGTGRPTIEETRSLLQQYGPIDETWPTTYGDARRLEVPEGMWVRFTYYLDFKDAIKQFNAANNEFRLHVPVEPTQQTSRDTNQTPPAHQSFRIPRSATDQKSIFVGNLPPDVTEMELSSFFGRFGTIKAVNVIHKPIQGGTGYNVFGFIEFSEVHEAGYAAEQEIDLRGQRIRVEPKEYSARRATRLHHYPAVTPPSGPHWNNMQNMPNMYSPGHQVQYSPSPSHYYSVSPAPQGYNNMPQEMSPFHPGGGYTNNHIYATPPPMNRTGRRNDIFLGSPNGIQYYSPAHYPPTYNMGPIHENYEDGQNMM